MKTITFRVNQRHIDNGVRKSPGSCPIAQALKEHFNTFDVRVERDFFRTPSFMRLTPRSMTEFIDAFDRGDIVEPREFSFEVRTCVADLVSDLVT